MYGGIAVKISLRKTKFNLDNFISIKIEGVREFQIVHFRRFFVPSQFYSNNSN